MSRISGILLGASVASFYLSSIIQMYIESHKFPGMDVVGFGWAWGVAQLSADGYDAWEVISSTMFLEVISSPMFSVAFACIFCAILLCNRDIPHKYQKLFPE